jgi:hypothetical protein
MFVVNSFVGGQGDISIYTSTLKKYFKAIPTDFPRSHKNQQVNFLTLQNFSELNQNTNRALIMDED